MSVYNLISNPRSPVTDTPLLPRSGQPVYHKPARSPELPSVRKSPWSTSLDSAALPPFPSPGPGSPCSPIGRIQFPPIVSSSLFESTPFNANNGADAKQTVEPRRPKDAATPFDLSDLGVSTGAEAAAGGQAAKPSVWDEKPVPAVSSSSLFSSVLRPNNWVNFLDAAGGNGLATQPANKTMSEIWDSGSSALDGWAGYDSSRQLPTTPDGSQQVRPIGSEAHAVDSLFSQPPVDWPEPRAPSPTQHAFGGADLPWSSSVWSSSSGASSTESGCVSPTSGFAFPLSSSGIGAEGDRAQTPPVVTSAYAPLGGSGIWNPGPWSTCKDWVSVLTSPGKKASLRVRRINSWLEADVEGQLRRLKLTAEVSTMWSSSLWRENRFDQAKDGPGESCFQESWLLFVTAGRNCLRLGHRNVSHPQRSSWKITLPGRSQLTNTELAQMMANPKPFSVCPYGLVELKT